MKLQKFKPHSGFSLVEVVIAIGIVAILLTTFMSVFGPAQQKIGKALSIADANRLVSTLEGEMATLRPTEQSDYVASGTGASAFEKAFQWIKDSHSPSSAILVYQYQAQPDSENNDGTLKAAANQMVADDSSLPGVDYITQTIARRIDKAPSGTLQDELVPGVVEGRVYVVRMTQLVRQNGAMGLGDAGRILNQSNSGSGTGTEASSTGDYDEAFIAFRAEFFELNNNLYSYVTGGTWDFDKLGAPVVSQNIAIRR
ncbi:type IV pilus modification PilV family protein [Rubritalea marina]|uniref:type IV pilus modification PilV family protein n=1 Tax=Rubritalea marina TaxID=361055 RepID=UPI000374DA8A|nr:type II secretion system protein [Rubritalea marina]